MNQRARVRFDADHALSLNRWPHERMQPRRRQLIYAELLVTLCLFGWLWLQNSRRTHGVRIEQTKQTVRAAAQTLESLRLRGLPLPASDAELAAALGGHVPRSAWGQPLSYQHFGLTNFVLSAMSPYPELLIISYDSRNTNAQLQAYLF